MTGAEYANLIAAYVARRFGARGVKVYREIRVGKSIIGKNRCIDVFCVCEVTNKAFAIECKFQDSEGTVDEKIPYTLDDLEAMPMAGCIAYAGKGFSAGVLHMLRASTRAAYCLPVADQGDATAGHEGAGSSAGDAFRLVGCLRRQEEAGFRDSGDHRFEQQRVVEVPRSHRHLPERLSARAAPKPRQRHALERGTSLASAGLNMARAFDSCDSSAEVVLERSTPAITNKFVDSIYSQLSPVYDVLFGCDPATRSGRRCDTNGRCSGNPRARGRNWNGPGCSAISPQF